MQIDNQEIKQKSYFSQTQSYNYQDIELIRNITSIRNPKVLNLLNLLLSNELHH